MLDSSGIDSAHIDGQIKREFGHARHYRRVNTPPPNTPLSPEAIARRIREWAAELGFDGVGITGFALDEDVEHLRKWLREGRHGTMEYMERHADLRADPARLQPEAIRCISVRMNYLTQPADAMQACLDDPERAYVSRYALGRDYHKLMRGRLKQLTRRLQAVAPTALSRPFVDSAPVLEKALGRDARLGWIGKHSLLLHRDAGSWFFLGEILTNLPLPVDEAPPVKNLCGSCSACIDICPTQAITGPQQLDARRCIAYLTIEHKGAIPEPLRKPMGNRIFGCDDCQLVCPWNRYAQATREPDFAPRHGLDTARLVDLFRWSEAEFLSRTEGMPIRRAGYQGWRRNLAVALGNAPASAESQQVLDEARNDPSLLVREHVDWARAQLDQATD